jgi:hypothetical protein
VEPKSKGRKVTQGKDMISDLDYSQPCSFGFMSIFKTRKNGRRDRRSLSFMLLLTGYGAPCLESGYSRL